MSKYNNLWVQNNEGDDVFDGRTGSDFVRGGRGTDTVTYEDLDVGVDVDLSEKVFLEDGFALAVEDQPVEALLASHTTDEIVEDALAGELYINIHTAEVPSGEIRGQLTAVSDTNLRDIRVITLTADLDSAQEPDEASDSQALGTASVTITVTPDGTTYSALLAVTGITTDELNPVSDLSAIHIHASPAGANGPPVLDLVVDAGGEADGSIAGSPDDDVFTETSRKYYGVSERETGFSLSVEDTALSGAILSGNTAQEVVELALADGLYFNVHTADYGGGEIRGQLITASDETDGAGVRTIVLDAALDGAQEPEGASDSTATGAGQITLTVTDAGVSYSGTLSVTGLLTSDLMPVGDISSIHIHAAPAGENGPAIVDIVQDAGGDVDGTALSAASDTGDGNVFVEVTETDRLSGVENATGSREDDVLLGSRKPNQIHGSDGNDFVDGERGRDRIWGDDGDDRLIGGGGSDRLHGGDGDDVLRGGRGRDVLEGGEGSDLFLFARKVDTDVITDFDYEEDSIKLVKTVANSFEDLDLREKNGNVIVRLSDGDHFVIRDVMLSMITEDHFDFA